MITKYSQDKDYPVLVQFSRIDVHRDPMGPGHGALVRAGGRVMRCALGRSGPTVFKREGDGATPAQQPMRPLGVFFRWDRVRRPVSTLPVMPIRPEDGWCDAPAHPAYNCPVRLPFAASHETMMREDCLYDIGVILDFNMLETGRRRGRGSAIFLHCAKPGYQPTAGCIALDQPDLEWLLPYLGRETRILVQR